MSSLKPISLTVGAALASLLAGCGGDIEEPAGETITGKAINTYHTSSGTLEQPHDPEEWVSIEAIADDGSGEQVVYPGSLAADGTFEIPGVPAGPYLLAITYAPPPAAPEQPGYRAYYRETARTLDFGMVFSRRPDVEAITKPTSVRLEAPLTKPWQAIELDAEGNYLQENEDTLFFVSKNAGISGHVVGDASDPTQINAPLNAATSLAEWQIDAAALAGADGDDGGRLVESDKGDDLILLHGVATQVDTSGSPGPEKWNGYTLTSVVEALVPAPVTMADGATTSLTGNFKALPLKTFAFDYSGTSFGAQLAEAPPSGQSSGFLDVSLDFEAGAPEPQVGAYTSLLGFQAYGLSGDLAVAPITDYARDYEYGNPFTYGQELFNVTLAFYSRADEFLPADGTPERLRGYLSITDSAAELSGTPLEPWIGLPRKLTVNGEPAPAQQVTSGVGTAPEIAFEAPSTGTPDFYAVLVVDLDDVKDGDDVVSAYRTVATIRTQETRLTVPQGLLTAGKHYYFRVGAYLRAGYDPASPFGYTTRQASAVSFTGIVVP